MLDTNKKKQIQSHKYRLTNTNTQIQHMVKNKKTLENTNTDHKFLATLNPCHQVVKLEWDVDLIEVQQRNI